MTNYISAICPKCKIEFNCYSKHGNKKFCSRSCANSHTPSEIHLAKLKKTVAAKTVIKNQFGIFPRKHKTFTKLKIEKIIAGPFTKIYLCKCKITGIQWYSTTVKTIHPLAHDTKNRYAYQCRFNFSISQYPKWFTDASKLIKEYGWYSTPGSRKGQKNTNGISRDHLFSINDGFRNNIDPKILSHPANCRLLPHRDNQRKGKKSIITLSELYSRIEQFNKLYLAPSEGLEPPM